MKWLNTEAKSYSDSISKLFSRNNIRQEDITSYMNLHSNSRNITIQVTEDCNCACTYCYQINKHPTYMTKATGKSIIDLLFKMWDENDTYGFINKTDTKAIILDFIGGEPLLNIDIIDYICEYFWTQCILRNHIWKNTWMMSFSSNGSLYFSSQFQKLLKKYGNHLDYNITVDGPKQIHDKCRVYKSGKGSNFDDAYKALLDYKTNYNTQPGTKITISPDNLVELNTIIDFFFENDIYVIHGNVIYEQLWTIDQATEYYKQLKLIADKLIKYNHDAYISFFEEIFFQPLDLTKPENNRNWCGGSGAMLAFDPNGIAYPCLRYMPSSLGCSQKPLVIGNCENGIYQTKEQQKIKNELDSITLCSQSSDECIKCPIAKGCAWCSGWNYQQFGTVNKRSTNICNMQKARSLANVYFWNKYYLQEHIPKTFHRYLPDEEALKFIDQKELNMLNNLENQTKQIKEVD